MKKLWLLPLFCILLWGCTGDAPPPEESLFAAMEITFATEGVEGILTITEEGCTFGFTKPDTLKKLTLFYDGAELTAKYGSMETKVPKSFLGRILPIYDLLSAFRDGTPEQTGENIRRVALDEREFLLYYNVETNRITELEVKGADGTYVYEVLSYIEKNDDTESTGSD